MSPGLMPRQPMSEAEARETLSKLDGWQFADEGRAIAKTFTFRSFNEAFGFMTRAALAAEKLDHHPDWSNSYRTVSVRLSTHDAGGLTQLDFTLAARMDRFAAPARA